MKGTKAKTILVVDDEPDIVQALETRLNSRGFRVLRAYDGAQATARIQKERPDLVLLDIHLPGGDGLTVMRRNGSSPKGRIPVVAMTADPSWTTERSCHELGCAGFFRKPYEPNRLFEAIERALPGDR
ncbi:MAG: response regulator [Candidatus Eisenbacteria bacterium]|nr:response regulator [Candidatus Latescibacterota bacterium]MBD3302930.1 response regulator [Candidatus Eisenbacteria bacterium]